MLVGERRHRGGRIEHDLVLLLRHLPHCERDRRRRHVDRRIDSLIEPLPRDCRRDVRLVLVVGADQVHVEAEMRLHLLNRQLRGGDRSGTGVVAIRAGQVGQHTEPDYRLGLGACVDNRRGAENGGAAKQPAAGQLHIVSLPVVLSSFLVAAGRCQRAPTPYRPETPGPRQAFERYVLVTSSERWLAREAVRREPPRLRALAYPVAQIGFGPRLVAKLPGQAVGQPEHLRVGQPAFLVALQNHAAAARHLRHLIQRKNQQLTVVADYRDMIAIRQNTQRRFFARLQIQHLLAGPLLRSKFRSPARGSRGRRTMRPDTAHPQRR